MLLQSMTSVISTSAMVLLQSATGITKCDGYYKVRQNNGVTREAIKAMRKQKTT